MKQSAPVADPLDNLRQPLRAAYAKVDLSGPLYLQPLLSHPKLLGGFAKFVEATGRFPDLA
ncbi:hypothetical protein DFH08DRAFT_946872 [Mycena albidolilacea]|uniref:Uncharacterized protein n=1 Tax=Mycena albidolilacea TaxID=1033008 RepID=A0AAD7ATN6_9AGAR|nr:hypothetical protein DFH08DRAFT_946872 [Mycena albidolilacea]